MVTLKKRPRTLETPVNSRQINSHEQQECTKSGSVSGYEQCREKRIKENMERMQKLGLFDLSSKLKSDFSSPKRSPKRLFNKRTPQPSPLDLNSPPRRSSRLLNGTPISYAEEPRPKRERGKPRKHSAPFIGEGSRPEVYTEEDEKLLGSTEMPWTLFVDGCGPDGRRIYDSVNGKTCHQCRQKTMGHRTHCKECNLVQGQFCGDCLYMRYGEHVLEANKNPDWICPPCRGICNCSLCRQARGWPATGQLYKKISHLGFKSVAHYLIQTRRAEPKKSDDIVTGDPVTNSVDVGTDDPNTVKRSLPFAKTEEIAEHKGFKSSGVRKYESSTHSSIDKGEDGLEENKKESLHLQTACGNEANLNVDSGVSSANEANLDSIGKRLKQRRNRSSLSSDNLLGTPMHVLLDSKLDELGKAKKQSLNVDSAHDVDHDVAAASPASPDRIAKRLRQRRNKSGEQKVNYEEELIKENEEPVNEHLASDVAPGSQTKISGKSVIGKEDSISGRLRQRRNKV